jgi:hypothetical protein
MPAKGWKKPKSRWRRIEEARAAKRSEMKQIDEWIWDKRIINKPQL